MTNRKIAQLAGVSPATVSKVFSGSKEISAETAERVLRIARDNGISERRRFKRERGVISVAVLLPEIISVSYSHIATDIVEIFSSLGVCASVYVIGFEEKSAFDIINTLSENGLCDGAVLMLNIKNNTRFPIPVVIIEGSGGSSDYIHIDIISGIREAVGHLVKLSHTEIGFIGEKNTTSKSDTFITVMREYGLEPDPEYIYISDKRFEEIGYEAVNTMLARGRLPTALITAYDEIALGAIHAFQNNSIRVPEDISVIGMNDISFSSYSSVPLTTIRTYSREHNRLAANILLEKIKNPDYSMVVQVNVPCRLIIRETTAKAPR